MEDFISSYSVPECKDRILKTLSGTSEWASFLLGDVVMRTLYMTQELCNFELYEKIGRRSNVKSFELKGSLKKQNDHSTLVSVTWRPTKTFFIYLPIVLIGYILTYIWLANSLGRLGMLVFVIVFPVALIIGMVYSRYRMIRIIKKALVEKTE